MPNKKVGFEQTPSNTSLGKAKTISKSPGYYPDDLRTRRRKLCFDAERGDPDAMRELLEVALRLCLEIDINTETSPALISFASLVNPIKYMLDDEAVMLAAFGTKREACRPKSKSTEQRQRRIAEDIGRNLAAGCTKTEAIGSAAEANGVSERTAQRAYENYKLMVGIVKRILEKQKKDSDE